MDLRSIGEDAKRSGVAAQKIGLSLEETGTGRAKLPPDRAPKRRGWARLR